MPSPHHPDADRYVGGLCGRFGQLPVSCARRILPHPLVLMHYTQSAVAISFILFGLWTLRGDTLEDEDKRFNYSPFWTVAVAFFIAEMGDKTQLATVALAAKYDNRIAIWMGTTSGMLIADAIGIIVSIVFGKRIPERSAANGPGRSSHSQKPLTGCWTGSKDPFPCFPAQKMSVLACISPLSMSPRKYGDSSTSTRLPPKKRRSGSPCQGQPT
jgi:hypothetical protein